MFRDRPSKVVALVLMVGIIVGCAEGGPQENDEGADEATQQEGGDTVVDWDEGLTQKEQLAEIEFVVSVMQDHFGNDVARLQGGEWDLEGFVNLKGNPRPSHRADDHYYYEVNFDMSGVEANQETQEEALAVLEELGLSPNGEQPATYDEDRRPPLDVTGGEDNNGRIFRIEQLSPEGGIAASFSTRHSDHPSMYEAYEASWE